MQNIIIEKPYQFIPPYHGTHWSSLFKLLGIPEWYLRRYEGITKIECRRVDRLRASIDAGHGILLTPNHPRTTDPLAMGRLAAEARALVELTTYATTLSMTYLTRGSFVPKPRTPRRADRPSARAGL